MQQPKRLKNILNSEIDPAFAKRAKIIFNWIQDIKPQKILDAGCGRGFYVNSLTHFSFIKEIHGCDINSNYLKIVQKNAQDRRIILKQANLYRLPYPNDYFDCIICSEVLEHLKDDIQALKELKRVLKHSGFLLISVPNKNFPLLWDPLNWLLMKIFGIHVNKNIWWLAGIWADHERLYSQKEIINTLQRAKLEVLTSHLVLHWCWPFSHFLLYGIGKNIIERLNPQSLYRFMPSNASQLGSMLAYLFSLPTTYLDKPEPKQVSVNIVIQSRKV